MAADPKQTHVATQWKHESRFICCRFDPQGRYVFAGAEDYAIHRFEVDTGTKVTLPEHDCWVRAFAFTPDGETMISAGSDGQLVWWPVAEAQPKPQRTVAAHDGWIRALAVSPDGKILASGGNDNRLKLWNITDGTLIHESPPHDSNVYSTFFHPGGEFVLSGTLLGAVKQWEVGTGKLVREFDAKTLHTYNGGQAVDYGGIRSMALSPDGQYFACGGLHKASNPLGAVNEPLVELFEWESQKKKVSHISDGKKGIIWRVVYHPDAFLMGGCGGSGGGLLFFWKPDQDKPFHTVKLPDTVRDMDLHPDGLRIATAHYDRHIRISSMTPKA
ncbi:WD domain, G-beta repeat [Symmachiella dynata]|uniref:WD40 repeat domain-containing protein n=1 Tax=Symmachiella dynata TaxID=2527995 RepID=UPI00118B5AA1|nr:WD40 repeat domain-containing protein [Symmachiella dynata]QDT47528.1 WD domain, G-beta repeat [Symmachiella dynata]